MQILLIAVGDRMPEWVEAGYKEYAKRLRPPWRLRLIEIAAGRRTKRADIKRLIEQEGARQLAAVPSGSRIIALDREGRVLDTGGLTIKLKALMVRGGDLALLIGGPEGLAPECRARADDVWSLSALTFAHPVVRVVLAEQLYRAWSILNNLPYHR